MTLYTSVKQSALRKLWHDGDLKDIQKERAIAETQIMANNPHELFGNRTSREERKQLTEVQDRWREKVSVVAHAKGVDTFSGAWQSLPANTRAKTIAFSAGAGVVAGAVTRLFTNPRYTRGGGSSDSGGDSSWVDYSHDHHHHGFDGGFDGGFD